MNTQTGGKGVEGSHIYPKFVPVALFTHHCAAVVGKDVVDDCVEFEEFDGEGVVTVGGANLLSLYLLTYSIESGKNKKNQIKKSRNTAGLGTAFDEGFGAFKFPQSFNAWACVNRNCFVAVIKQSDLEELVAFWQNEMPVATSSGGTTE